VETLSRSWPTGVGSCLLRCHRKLEGCFLVTLAKKVGFQTQQRWNFPLALQMRRMFLWIVIVNPRRRIPKKPFSLYILSPVLHTVIAGSLLFPSGPHKEKQCRLFSFWGFNRLRLGFIQLRSRRVPPAPRLCDNNYVGV